MRGRYDVVVIGAGHNGLVAAAYLAKAGKSVLVVERAETAGGTIGGEQIAPGFTAPLAFPSAERLHPAVVKELHLQAHGLRMLAPAGITIAGAGGPLRFDGLGHIAGGNGDGAPSPADREALAELERLVGRIAGALEPLYGKPLPELEELRAADTIDLLKVGWRLRRLGRSDMREAMRFLPMSIRDVAEERIESPTLRAALAGLGVEGAWLGPFSAGTAFNLVHHRIGAAGALLAGPSFVAAGMGALAAALEGAARAAGAEVRTGAEVIRVDAGPGGARGVTLADGSDIECKTVVSDADPRRTLLGLVDAGLLAPEFLAAVANIRSRGGVAVVGFALDGLTGFAGGSSRAAPATGRRAGAGSDPSGGGSAATGSQALLQGRIQLGGGVHDIERAFDAAQDGRLPERPLVQLTIPSLLDNRIAPEGRHVATAWVQSVPRHLRPATGAGAQWSGRAVHVAGEGEDGWQQGREALVDAVVAVIEEALPGFGDRVRARRVLAPPDLEARFAASGGCLYDVDVCLDQALFLRPLPGWCRHRTPIDGLYLCGSGTHGGGGVSGLAGRNAAAQVLADLKARRQS
jgi:phytoene dehydrogenase-like protein